MCDFTGSERFASIMRSSVLSAYSTCLSTSYLVWSRFKYYVFVDLCDVGALPIICNGSKPARTVGGSHGGEPFAPREVAHRFTLP